MTTRKFLRAIAKGECPHCRKGILWACLVGDKAPGGMILNPMRITTKCAKCKKGAFRRSMTEDEVIAAQATIARIDAKRNLSL